MEYLGCEQACMCESNRGGKKGVALWLGFCSLFVSGKALSFEYVMCL
jgi:hypothetical protein